MPKAPDRSPIFHHRAFALPLNSTFRLPALISTPPSVGALNLELVTRSEVERLWSAGSREAVWTTMIDERPYTMERGRAGDHLMAYGDDALFLLSPDGHELRCAPAEPTATAWQRFLLDTVLWSASLLNGVELLHSSAVQGPAGVVAFAGFSGCGKTSLAAELLGQGFTFFTDDILALTPARHEVRVHPGPAAMNLPQGNARPEGLGEILAPFEHEDWVAVERAAAEPDRLAAVCLLRRRPGSWPGLRRLQSTVLDVLPFTLGFPHLPGRMRQRFTLFAGLAAEVPIYELTAPLDAPPRSLTELVEPLLFGRAPRRRAA